MRFRIDYVEGTGETRSFLFYAPSWVHADLAKELLEADGHTVNEPECLGDEDEFGEPS